MIAHTLLSTVLTDSKGVWLVYGNVRTLHYVHAVDFLHPEPHSVRMIE